MLEGFFDYKIKNVLVESERGFLVLLGVLGKIFFGVRDFNKNCYRYINEIRLVFKNWNMKINKMYLIWDIFKNNLSGLFFLMLVILLVFFKFMNFCVILKINIFVCFLRFINLMFIKYWIKREYLNILLILLIGCMMEILMDFFFFIKFNICF